MGGMRALEWAVGYPDRVDRCHRHRHLRVLHRRPDRLERPATRGDPGRRRTSAAATTTTAQPPLAGMAVARQIAHTTYRSALELNTRFGRDRQGDEDPLRGGRYAVQSYLQHHGDKLGRRFDPNSYLVLTEAMNTHDIGRGRGGVDAALQRISAELTVAVVDSDRLFLPAQGALLATAPTARPLITMHSDYGHDGFLIEADAIATVVRDASGGLRLRRAGRRRAGRLAPIESARTNVRWILGLKSTMFAARRVIGAMAGSTRRVGRRASRSGSARCGRRGGTLRSGARRGVRAPAEHLTEETVMPLRLGYKASAEQFGPVELADFAVDAEQAGFDSVFISDHLQPWRHDGGHAPAALPWLGAVGARTERVLLGTSVLTPTFRYHPAVIAQAFATLGRAVPGPGHPRRRLGRVAERGAARPGMAGRQGAVRPAQGGRHADPRAVDRGAGHLRRHVLPDRQGHHLRPARRPGADLHRRVRSGRDPAGRPDRRRVHHHVRQGADAVLGHAAAGARRGRGQGRPHPGRPRPADRDEGVVRPGPGQGAGRTPSTGRRSRSPRSRRAASRTRSRCSGSPTSCRSSRRRPGGSSPPIRDEHVEKIKAYLDLGFRHLVFHAPGPDQERFLKLYGEQVLPRLRALGLPAEPTRPDPRTGLAARRGAVRRDAVTGASRQDRRVRRL